jgi:hypothetical protein
MGLKQVVGGQTQCASTCALANACSRSVRVDGLAGLPVRASVCPRSCQAARVHARVRVRVYACGLCRLAFMHAQKRRALRMSVRVMQVVALFPRAVDFNSSYPRFSSHAVPDV